MGWTSYGETLTRDGNWSKDHTIDRADAEAVFKETFSRVRRNTNRLIIRLRDLGYAFECEAGRELPPGPPRQDCSGSADAIHAHLEERSGDLPAFHSDAPPFPPSPYWFCKLVGHVDLRQRFAPREQQGMATDPNPVDPQTRDLLSAFHQNLDGIFPAPTRAEKAWQAGLLSQDRALQLNTGDPVLDPLGDWDPFCIDLLSIASQLNEPEAEMSPVDGGGLALFTFLAPSYEHKANISGGDGLTLRLPDNSPDPLLTAEGIKLPFTTYLRRVFKRGGFFGVPSHGKCPRTL